MNSMGGVHRLGNKIIPQNAQQKQSVSSVTKRRLMVQLWQAVTGGLGFSVSLLGCCLSSCTSNSDKRHRDRLSSWLSKTCLLVFNWMHRENDRTLSRI